MPIRSPKWLFAAALVLTAPETPGVFELWDDDEMIFVGATHGESLRECLVHEMSAHHATHFSWEITFRPDSRRRELLEEFLTAHRRSPRLNSDDA